MFYLIVENRLAQCHNRVKDIAGHISVVADEILILLEGCGDLADIQTLECNLRAHRDVILMSLGWLIREGYVRAIAGHHETFILRVNQEPAATNLKNSCFV